MQTISHSSILELEELFEGDNYIYAVTQLYPGPKLSDVIVNLEYVLDDKVTSVICLRLLEALAHLEHKGIIHRDLKPDNIVFRDTTDLSQPVLVDLGFATYVPDYAYLFSRCGTPGYVAPEILLDLPYDSKADVFSLGVTLYMMLHRGTNPFMSDDYQQLVDNNAAGVVDYSEIEERWLTPLIQQMLEQNPENRPSASQLITAYSAILEKGPDLKAESAQERESTPEELEIDQLELRFSEKQLPDPEGDRANDPSATKNLDEALNIASQSHTGVEEPSQPKQAPSYQPDSPFSSGRILAPSDLPQQ